MPFSRREIWAASSLAGIRNCAVVEIFVPRHRLAEAYTQIKRHGWGIVTDEPDVNGRHRLVIGGEKAPLLRFAESCRRGVIGEVREKVLEA
jgi:hypothetical protein